MKNYFTRWLKWRLICVINWTGGPSWTACLLGGAAFPLKWSLSFSDSHFKFHENCQFPLKHTKHDTVCFCSSQPMNKKEIFCRKQWMRQNNRIKNVTLCFVTLLTHFTSKTHCSEYNTMQTWKEDIQMLFLKTVRVD